MAKLVCPTCRIVISYRLVSEAPYRPFCSKRCQRIDLYKWLTEQYVISEEPAWPGETEEPEPRPDRAGSDE